MAFSGDNDFNCLDFDPTKHHMPTVAMTFGNGQSVRSTYIAHDPFFFMDVDDEVLEEELLRELEFEDYEESFYLDAPEATEDLFDIIEAFDKNTESYASSGSIVKNDTTDFTLAQLKKRLSASRYMASLLEFAEEEKVSVHMSPAVYASEFNKSENIILLNPNLPEQDMVKAFICSLRQAWQSKQGALIHPLSFYPDHGVFAYRAQHADIAVSLIRTAWELHLAGDEELWEDLEKGSMTDIARSFAREAVIDFRSLNNGVASYAAFETWFLSDRSRSCDSALIQRMLSEYQGHTFEDEDMSYLIVVELIAALGEMPYGKNYLSNQVVNLINDPIFTEVRERSNANFLWFIKFEKSFRDMEQSLQIEDGLSGQGGSHLNSLTPFAGDPHEKESETRGQILSFPKEFMQRSTTSNERNKNEKEDGASGEVIPFDITVRPFNTTFS